MAGPRTAASRAWVWALVVLGGCQLTADLGSLPSASSTGSSTLGESSEDSDSDGDTDSGETTDTGTDTGGSGVCEVDGSETPCQICIEQLCCPQLEACVVVPSCVCMADCIEVSQDPVTCAARCAPGLTYFEYVQCQVASCAAACV